MSEELYLYFVRESPDEGCGVGVVARSAGDAKCIAMGVFLGPEFIDLRVNKKGVAPDGMGRGEIEDEVLALRLGVYGYLEDCRCPTCGNVGTVEQYDKGPGCEDCLGVKE